MTILGVLLSVYAVMYWRHTGYAELKPEIVMRIAIPAASLLELGMQAAFSGFMIGIFKIKVEKEVKDE